METVLDFLDFDKNENTYIIEGYNLLSWNEKATVEPCLLVNDKLVPCEKIKRYDKVTVCCEKEVSQRIGFRAAVVAEDDEITIRTAVKTDSLVVESEKFHFGKYFPVSDIYRFGYANIGRYFATVENQNIILSKRKGRITELVRENRFLCEAWKRNRNNSRKAVAYRLLYRFAELFKYKKLWIISDFVSRADDNGEALFQYLQVHKPRRTKVVFAIRKDSPDYHRISKTAHCVDVTSHRFKLLFLLCDVNISSHADQWYFYSHLEETRDIHARTKYVFLQHGITENSVYEYLSRYNINISGFVTAALPEYDSIKDETYGYRKGEIWLTGFPRFDRLFHAEKKCITIMPTWRKYLVENLSAVKGTWDLKAGFEEQEFYIFYDALINSDRLLRALQQLGYRLQFFPHPVINPYIDKFHHDPRVSFLPIAETTYRDVFAMSDLMVTDYSSAILDFAYLRKPLFFCQFDYEYFYSDHYQKGYYDYEKDGFGEVVCDLDHTIDLIIEYAKDGCVLKDKYRERIDAFFAFNDRNNCQRVADKINSL